MITICKFLKLSLILEIKISDEKILINNQINWINRKETKKSLLMQKNVFKQKTDRKRTLNNGIRIE